MNISKFSRALKITLTSVLLLGSQLAAAQFDTGSVINLNWSSLGSQSGGNGAFSGSIVSGPGAGTSFVSFCLEKFETFNLNSNLFVKNVSTTTTTADPLSAETAWLFSQYSNNAVGYTATTNSKNLSMQNAFWFLEGEITQSVLNADTQAKNWVTAAQTAVTSGAWSGVGNVRVLNLYKDVNYGTAAQDQLVMLAPVPEPETYAMLLAGLGMMGAVVRKRKQTRQL